MPDEIATRATLMLTLGVLASALGGWLVALLWRRARAPGDSSNVGVAATLALMTAGFGWVVWDMAAFTWRTQNLPLVQGELLGFDAVKLRESRSGRKLWGRGPVVAFRTPDGREHLLTGLSGSQGTLQPGDPVMLRVDPAAPERAVIADFQHQGAALWLFGIFAGMSALGALSVGLDALGSGSPKRVPSGPASGRRGRPPPASAATGRAARWPMWRDGPQGQHWRAQLRRVALATAVLAIVSPWLWGDALPLLRALAATFAGLAASALLFTAARMLNRGAPVPSTLLGGAVGVYGFGMFAAFLWQLGPQ
jgi:Protein of unknown function (DUF3592)